MKKTKIKEGDYVRVGKKGFGVVQGMVAKSEWDGDKDHFVDVEPRECYVASVGTDGYSNSTRRVISSLVKVAPPQYVVVWSDFYNDPFCQFGTRAEAVAFAQKLSKRKGDYRAVETRIYKLTK